MKQVKVRPQYFYAAHKDGLACVICGRSKNSHRLDTLACLPKQYWIVAALGRGEEKAGRG